MLTKFYFRCGTCDKEFSSKRDTMRHCEGHLGTTHSCSVCSYKCKSRASLGKHYSKHGIRRDLSFMSGLGWAGLE